MGSIGGIANAAASNLNTAMNIAYQTAENGRNRDFVREQSMIDRNFQWDSMEAQQRFAAEQQEDQQQFEEDFWREQMEYQSYSSDIARMMEAGLNPAVMLGSGGGSGGAPLMGGGSALGAGSPVSGAHASAPTPNTSSPFQLSADIANFAKASKDDAQAKETVTLLEQRYNQLVLKNAGEELQNFQTELSNQFLSKTMDNRVKNEYAKLLVNTANIGFIKSNEHYMNEKALSEQFDQFNKVLDSNLKGQELAQAKILTAHYEDMLLADIKLRKTQATEASANANRSNAQAGEATSHAKLMDVQKDISVLDKQIKERDNRLDAATFRSRLEAAIDAADIDAKEKDRALSRLKAFDELYYHDVEGYSHPIWVKFASMWEKFKNEFPSIVSIMAK